MSAPCANAMWPRGQAKLGGRWQRLLLRLRGQAERRRGQAPRAAVIGGGEAKRQCGAHERYAWPSMASSARLRGASYGRLHGASQGRPHGRVPPCAQNNGGAVEARHLVDAVRMKQVGRQRRFIGRRVRLVEWRVRRRVRRVAVAHGPCHYSGRLLPNQLDAVLSSAASGFRFFSSCIIGYFRLALSAIRQAIIFRRKISVAQFCSLLFTKCNCVNTAWRQAPRPTPRTSFARL